MTPKDYRNSLKACLELAGELGLNPLPGDLLSFSVDETARNMALEGESFLDYYVYCVENRLFNFILSDGSFFQFDTTIQIRPFTLRYCFVPSALEPVPESEEAEGEAAPLVQNAKSDARPLLRYEYVESEYRPFAHPAAHLHVGFSKSGRLLVDRILLPLDFFSFAIRWLYGEHWYKEQDDQPEYGGYRYERVHAKSLLDCRAIPAEYVQDAERNLLHLSVLRNSHKQSAR